MRVLGIESSCDETAASVVEDGRRVISHVVVSQIDIHKEYGGVVPEVAARSHIEVINPVINRALKQAGCTWDDIDAIAVTYAPGLIGSLLVGTLAARTLAVLHNKPLYPIHHVEAHVYANFVVEVGPDQSTTRQFTHSRQGEYKDGNRLTDKLDSRPTTNRQVDATSETLYSAELPTVRQSSSSQVSEVASTGVSRSAASLAYQPAPSFLSKLADKLLKSQPKFPMLALIVSGGHTQLVLFRDHGDYTLLGQTRDDAVGEAFDKVAKILGLPYPGGPSIAEAALQGDPKKYHLPKAKLDTKYDFSFSGLKTAVLRAVQREVGKDFNFPSHKLYELVNDQLRQDFAASFQYTAVSTLVDKTVVAFLEFAPKSVVIAGGVAANQELRRQLQTRLPINIEYAPIEFCTDNATMIATLGYFRAQKVEPADPYTLEVVPSLSMKDSVWM